MAFVSMAEAVAGQTAKAAEYNNVVNNVNDLNTRVTSQATTVSQVQTDLGAAQSAIATLQSVKLPNIYKGSWTDDNNSSATDQTIVSSSSTSSKIIAYTSPISTPVGVSLSSGTVTVTNAGKYLVTASLQVKANSGSVLAMWIGLGSASSHTGTKYGPTSGFRADILSASAVLELSAGATFSVYAATWQGTAGLTVHRANGNNLSVTFLGT